MQGPPIRRLTALACATLSVLPAAATAATPAPCAADRWLASWTAAPSDAVPPADLSDPLALLATQVDVSGHPRPVIDDTTLRTILTPHHGGSTVRVHLTNRFGAAPVTFTAVTIGRQQRGAALVPGTIVPVTFDGRRSATAAPGADVVSDPVALTVRPFEHVAVSVHVAGAPGQPTEHYTARQTSYATPPHAGDRTGDAAGTLFLLPTTTAPYVRELDVRAPGRAGAVVAFGDSITDGFQGEEPGVPETREGLDADGRWPDILQRRLLAADRLLSVVNAGISGNRILRDGSIPQYGPRALVRLDADAIAIPGASTAIVLEGINDIGTGSGASADAVIGGLRQIVTRLHAAGLRVLLGTLTPAGGASGRYGSAAAEVTRQEVNRWIRSPGAADGVVDFDRAVRDPAHPERMDARYDGSDHLHLNLAGYRAMGEAVPLGLLRDAPCAAPLRVRAVPRRLVAGRRTTVRISVRRDGRPLQGARVRLGAARATTDATGAARLRVLVRRAGVRRLVVTADGARTAVALRIGHGG